MDQYLFSHPFLQVTHFTRALQREQLRSAGFPLAFKFLRSFFCRTSCFPCSSHNLCTGMCSHHLLCSRFRCILCKRAFVSHTVHGFLLYASAMSLYGTAACTRHNDAFLRCTGRAASSQRRCDRCLFFVVAPALRCSFRGIVQLVAS